MPIVVDNPVLKVFSRWSKDIEPVVGKGNYSMDKSQTNATGKRKYARLIFSGNPTLLTDLEGNECATILSFQTESYASGANSLSAAYEIDSTSHQSMKSMGFNRTYGPEEIANSDKNFKRIISRYSRVYTGKLLGEA